MIALKIIEAIANCFYIFLIMIFVRCLLTWIPGINWNFPIFKALASAVDLYLDLFRKFIPPVGPFDLSPIVATFVLIFLRNGIVYGAFYLFMMLGLIGQ
ncbi:YggT family protein [bacterium]|nr:YggT family protein [bacterium]